MMDYKTRLRHFMNSLYCINCGKRDLYARLSCLAYNRRSLLYLSWCDMCECEGRRVLYAQKES